MAQVQLKEVMSKEGPILFCYKGRYYCWTKKIGLRIFGNDGTLSLYNTGKLGRDKVVEAFGTDQFDAIVRNRVPEKTPKVFSRDDFSRNKFRIRVD